MKLLTDERTDIIAFKIDFQRACRKLTKALSRSGNSPEEVAAHLINLTKHVMIIQETIGLDSHEVWHCSEVHQAMDWLKIIVTRWLDNQNEDPRIPPPPLGELSAEMFMGVAQRVADEVTAGRYSASIVARPAAKKDFQG